MMKKVILLLLSLLTVALLVSCGSEKTETPSGTENETVANNDSGDVSVKDEAKRLSDEEKAKLKQLPTSLDEALNALEEDHDYLTQGGVFPEELITNFIKTKREEVRQLNAIPHPAEFEKYFNL